MDQQPTPEAKSLKDATLAELEAALEMAQQQPQQSGLHPFTVEHIKFLKERGFGTAKPITPENEVMFLVDAIRIEHAAGAGVFAKYKRVTTQFWISVACNVVLLALWWV